PIGGIVNTMFPGGSAVNCGNGLYTQLRNRFTFSGDGSCSLANISRVQTFYINGSPVTTKGIDFMADAKLGKTWDGDFGMGGSAPSVQDYHVDPVPVAGLPVQGSFEASGFLNYQTTAYPIPKWKGSAYLEYESSLHNLRFTFNYIDSYTDSRPIFTVNPRG